MNATITPNCFSGGTQVTVRATGFQAGEIVVYTINPPPGVDIPLIFASGTLTASANGTVELTNTLPAGLPTGLYSISFQGRSSARKGVIYFKILPN